jgi:hypothetical protein
MGIDDYYNTFAAVLETNGVSPHQVLLEAGFDDFANQTLDMLSLRLPPSSP